MPMRATIITASAAKMSPIVILIDIGEERCHTLLHWGNYTRPDTLQIYPRVRR
jgi:hypothetical protein